MSYYQPLPPVNQHNYGKWMNMAMTGMTRWIIYLYMVPIFNSYVTFSGQMLSSQPPWLSAPAAYSQLSTLEDIAGSAAHETIRWQKGHWKVFANPRQNGGRIGSNDQKIPEQIESSHATKLVMTNFSIFCGGYYRCEYTWVKHTSWLVNKHY